MNAVVSWLGGPLHPCLCCTRPSLAPVPAPHADRTLVDPFMPPAAATARVNNPHQNQPFQRQGEHAPGAPIGSSKLASSRTVRQSHGGAELARQPSTCPARPCSLLLPTPTYVHTPSEMLLTLLYSPSCAPCILVPLSLSPCARGGRRRQRPAAATSLACTRPFLAAFAALDVCVEWGPPSGAPRPTAREAACTRGCVTGGRSPISPTPK